MRYLLAVLLATLVMAIPASTQTVSGCLPVASNRIAMLLQFSSLPADAECLNRAANEVKVSAKVRLDQVAVMSSKATPPTSAPFVNCASEGKVCRGVGWGEIRYGARNQTRRVTLFGDVRCDNDTLGEPAPNVVKRCARRPTAAPLQPDDIKPIASNFATARLLVPGAHVAVPSNAPDTVGAFRMICTAGQILADDPILYPYRPGQSHLHQFFGNTGANAASDYVSLRNTGNSTCSNKINRSSYWVPALFNGEGKVIQPDYISLYYKRLPDGDPLCIKEAAKGCVGLPTGLRVVSGYDMARMGEPQPENATWHFRCIRPGKPSEHRLTITEAIADCGGAGQVMAMIGFGNCWTGTLDSADHRSHLTFGTYSGQSYPQCPASHPYLIPELTQGVVYTIQLSDGDVWFASDRMNGMKMASGSTFHADYMEAWDPTARTTWERQCIGKMLNCSDGELGDGTMLKRGALTYAAVQRLIDAPPR